MELFYQGCEITATGAEIIMLLYFNSKLLEFRYRGRKNYFFQLISFLVIFGYMLLSDKIFQIYNPISDMIVLLLYISYTLLFTKSPKIYQIVFPIICIIVIMTINVLIYFIISNIFKLKSNQLIAEQNNLRVASLFITKFLFFLLIQILLNHIHLKKARFYKKEFFSIFLVFFISAILTLYAAKLQYDSNQTGVKRFVIVFFIGIVLINICVFSLFSLLAEKNQKELQYTILQSQFEEQKKNYDSIYTVYHNLQILQHDMKNELLCIQKNILDGNNERANAMIEQITREKISNFYSYVKTGNDLIDMVLNIKLNYAKEKEIIVSCYIDTDFSGFDADDLVNLLANALDNAIEASVQQKERREIGISIKSKRNYLWIEVKNAISASVLQKNAKLSTTKVNRKYHGFGTESIRNLVKKYDGGIEYYEKDGWFILDIMMQKST